MSGEHRVYPQVGEQGGDARRPVLGPYGGHRLGQRFADRLLAGIPLAQRADPLMLFGQVGEVEVDGERVRDGLGALQRPGGDHVAYVVQGVIRGAARRDDGVPQALGVVEQFLAAGLAQHLAEQVAEQADIPAHRRRHVLAVGVPAHDASVARAARSPLS